MKSKRKAKQLLINKPFQLKFLSIFGTFIVGISLSYAFTVYISFMKFQNLGQKIGLKENHVFFKFLNEQMSELFTTFGISFIIIFTLFMYIGLRLSHRVAGPLYRLNMHLQEMSKKENNDYKPVKFRKKDLFMELEESFNKFIKNIE